MDYRRDNQPPYNYGDAGFNGFLDRSIGSTPRFTLSQLASDFRKVNNQQINFDHSSQTGTVGDTIQAGKAVRIDQKGLHLIDENNNEVLTAGFVDD